MDRTFKWTDSEEIALRLMDLKPGLDPLTVRFTDLRQWVINLEGFDDEPSSSNEAKLEAIQMAWHEEYQDAHG
jgi:FeS assembly protein IscX